MARAAVAAVLLALLIGAVRGIQVPNWYNCTCGQAAANATASPKDCVCPSLSAPGGLALSDTPQFILFTHDDAILELTDKMMRAVCGGRFNPDGCPFTATMFTMAEGTDCKLAQKMWKDGYEIADHSVNHKDMNKDFNWNRTVYEILGARHLISKCGIPESEIRGWRNPYLATNPSVRKILHQNGFLYDSTLMEDRTSWSLTPSMAKRVWPYTLQDGIPQNCAWYAPAQKCNTTERYPGMWEVPLWVLSAVKAYTMDYGSDGQPLFDLLMANFNATYYGNRAPFPIFIHTPWFNGPRVRDLQRFADYTLGLKNVYWVTMTQLIEWMNKPVPVSQMNGAMCGRPPAPPPPQPPPMPKQGINITASLRGSTAKLFSTGQPQLAAAVADMLGGSGLQVHVASLTELPSSTAPAPAPALAAAPAALPSAAPAASAAVAPAVAPAAKGSRSPTAAPTTPSTATSKHIESIISSIGAAAAPSPSKASPSIPSQAPTASAPVGGAKSSGPAAAPTAVQPMSQSSIPAPAPPPKAGSSDTPAKVPTTPSPAASPEHSPITAVPAAKPAGTGPAPAPALAPASNPDSSRPEPIAKPASSGPAPAPTGQAASTPATAPTAAPATTPTPSPNPSKDASGQATPKSRRLQNAGAGADTSSGHLQFEAPPDTTADDAALFKTFGGSEEGVGGGSFAIQESQTDAQDVAVEATIVVASSDPLRMYQIAKSEIRDGSFATKLAALNLELDGEPVVVPFRDGKVLAIPSPPPPALTEAPPPSVGKASIVVDDGATADVDDGDLSVGVIAAMATGGCAAVLLLVLSIVVLIRNRKAKTKRPRDCPTAAETLKSWPKHSPVPKLALEELDKPKGSCDIDTIDTLKVKSARVTINITAAAGDAQDLIASPRLDCTGVAVHAGTEETEDACSTTESVGVCIGSVVRRSEARFEASAQEPQQQSTLVHAASMGSSDVSGGRTVSWPGSDGQFDRAGTSTGNASRPKSPTKTYWKP